MAYPDGFWTFVRPCGCVYGSSVGNFATVQQAWADFYVGEATHRREAERKGCTCRPARPGDLDALRGPTCEHERKST